MRNSVENHTVHLSQTQYIINVYNNFQQHGVYCYGTPMDSKAQLSKAQCPTEGSAEASQMKNMPYRELIGSLLWVANGTRPDVSFAVNTLAKFTSNPGLVHWKALLRVLGYLYATKDYCIKYERNPEVIDGIDAQGYSRGFLPLTELDAYVDASFAGDVDTRRSTTGYVFKISGGPVSWQSRMQTSVALSSMEAEYMAASAATQEAMWLNRLLHQLGFRTPRPTVLYEDNKAAILFADHPGDHRRSKHIDTRKYFVRDAVLNGDVQLVYVPTTKQIADGLTKPLSSTLHQTLCVNNLLVRYHMI